MPGFFVSIPLLKPHLWVSNNAIVACRRRYRCAVIM